MADDDPQTEHWETLGQAFQVYGFPLENLPLVQRVMDSVGVARYEGLASRSYLKAIRRDGQRALTIHYGFTSGFSTEDEAIAAAGDVDREPHGKRWRVNHPLNDVGEHHRGGYGGGAAQKQPETCPECFTQLPASGVCDHCD